MTHPRISTPSHEGQFQAAKWLKIQALLDPVELSDLLSLCPPTWIYPLSGLFALGDVAVPKERLTSVYAEWIDCLKSGQVLDPVQLRLWNALCWTRRPEAVWLQEVPGNRYLVKVGEPVVQIQVHYMSYSEADLEFRSMALGQSAIFWGLQFSFPQVYQDPKTLELIEGARGENWELFQHIRHYVREETLPTPVMINGKRKNLPMRLGRRCFSWIGMHRALTKQGLSIYGHC